MIDSHTAGEPTRVILDGGPDLGTGTVAELAARLEQDHMDFCRAVLLEPRGHDAIVGALLVPASDPGCATGVIYFNPAGNLGMCGHATIGLAVTLAYLGRIVPGSHRFETPVGVVAADLVSANEVAVVNVESYRHLKDVTIDVEGLGAVRGDVAWGGNWFFLTGDTPCALEFGSIGRLSDAALRIRKALETNGITGADGEKIDHVEFFAPAHAEGHHGRNFVLCPGGAYDRSPCGTGTSAKVACLADDGKLEPNEEWIQESIIDSIYRLTYQPGTNGSVVPTIVGTAYVTSVGDLIFDTADPYATGILASFATSP